MALPWHAQTWQRKTGKATLEGKRQDNLKILHSQTRLQESPVRDKNK